MHVHVEENRGTKRRISMRHTPNEGFCSEYGVVAVSDLMNSKPDCWRTGRPPCKGCRRPEWVWLRDGLCLNEGEHEGADAASLAAKKISIRAFEAELRVVEVAVAALEEGVSP